MPKLRNRKPGSLATRNSSKCSSASLNETQGSEKETSRSSHLQSKTLPATRLNKDDSKTKGHNISIAEERKDQSLNETHGSEKETSRSSRLQSKTLPATSLKKDDSKTKAHNISIAEVRKDPVESKSNASGQTKGKKDAVIKGGKNESCESLARSRCRENDKHVDMEEEEKENINVNKENSKVFNELRFDSRKSIDPSLRRKNTISAISNYTREELSYALLRSEDAITELHMKYKRAKALHVDFTRASIIDDEKHSAVLAVNHEREELKRKLEIQKYTHDDQISRIKNEMGEKVRALEKKNKDIEENNKDLNKEITLLMKKSMKDEDANKCNLEKENQELKDTKRKMEERLQYLSNQVVEIDKTKNVSEEENKKNLELIKKMDKEIKRLSNEVAKLDKSNCDLKEQDNNKSEEILLLKKAMEDEHAIKCDLECENQELKDTKNKMEEELQDLSNQVVEMDGTKNVLQEENKKNLELITNLEEEVKRLSNEVAKLDKSNCDLKEQDNKKADEILLLKKAMEDENIVKSDQVREKEGLVNRILDVERINGELDKKVKVLCQQITQLEEAKDEAMERETVLQKGNEELETKILCLLDKISEMEKTNSEIGEEKRKLEEDVKTMKTYQVDLEEANSKMVSEYEQLCAKGSEVTEMAILNSVSPHARKDTTKYFLIQDSILKWIKDDENDIQMTTIYKNLILDLQEVMDFYSLLSGVSVWKTRSFDSEKTETLVRNGKFTQYHCELNPGLLNVAPNGYRFLVNINYEGGILKYSPDVGSDAFKTLVPKCLQDPLSFNVDQSYMFLKNILEM